MTEESMEKSILQAERIWRAHRSLFSSMVSQPKRYLRIVKKWDLTAS